MINDLGVGRIGQVNGERVHIGTKHRITTGTGVVAVETVAVREPVRLSPIN